MLDLRVVEELVSKAETLEKLHTDYIQSLEAYIEIGSQFNDKFPEGYQLAGELCRKAIQEHQSIFLLRDMTRRFEEENLPVPFLLQI